MMFTLRSYLYLVIPIAGFHGMPTHGMGHEGNDSKNSLDLSIFSVDFEESMGKNDPYMKEYYKKFIKRLKKPKNHFFRYIKAHSGIKLFHLCRKAYVTHKPFVTAQSPTRIPHIFHQIWVGGKPLPEKYKKWQKTWESTPGWTYKLWTDADVETFDFATKERYLAEKNMGARADILRLEILFRFGGVYVDTDFECLKPEAFAVLNSTYDFYCGITPLDRATFVVANGLIGSISGHPVLKACLDSLATQTTIKRSSFAIVNNGPGLLTQMVLRHANTGYRDIIFPPTFFYPLGVEQMLRKPYASMADTNEKLEKLKRDTVKPESVAIHWWDGSWKLPESWDN